MKQFKIKNNLFYYEFNNLDKKMQDDLKIIFSNKDIEYLTLSLKKWEKIKEKHIHSSGEEEIYKIIQNKIILFINKRIF